MDAARSHSTLGPALARGGLEFWGFPHTDRVCVIRPQGWSAWPAYSPGQTPLCRPRRGPIEDQERLTSRVYTRSGFLWGEQADRGRQGALSEAYPSNQESTTRTNQ
ncbi:unnamed protein product [Arctogadus glacialis]